MNQHVTATDWFLYNLWFRLMTAQLANRQ